ncbi:MAG: hypothetical protein KGM17_06460 [Sphingomonadales bacterium]|nr:hypothetical protein [Sphingomonadales bacterium]
MPDRLREGGLARLHRRRPAAHLLRDDFADIAVSIAANVCRRSNVARKRLSQTIYNYLIYCGFL